MPDRLINETDTIVLLPAHEVLGVPHAVTPNGLVALEELTAADINHYAVVNSLGHANAGAGGNISCAISSDDYTIGFTDSDESDERTLCDEGNSTELEGKNYEVDLTGFRDKTPTDTTSTFALWEALTFAPDIPYIVIHRVGFASDVLFADDQEYDAFYVHTDYPVPSHADGSSQKIQQVFVPKSEALQAEIL